IRDRQTNRGLHLLTEIIRYTRAERRVRGSIGLRAAATVRAAILEDRRRLDLEQVGLGVQHRGGQLFQRGDVQDVDTASVRRNDQVAVARVDDEVVDGY